MTPTKLLFFSIGFVFLIAVTGVLFQHFARYLYSYSLSERSVDVRLVGLLALWRIPYSDIQDVREVKVGEIFEGETEFSPQNLRLLRLGNRIIGRTVIIRLKRGLARAVALTPDNPQEFVEAIRRNIR
jgi:hypothetical protein